MLHLPHSANDLVLLATGFEIALLTVAYICGLRKGRASSAMRAYLLVNALGGMLVYAFVGFPRLLAGPNELVIYCSFFLVVYVASGVLTFLTAQQIFRDALEPLPGLRRLALVVFRWVAVVSVALSLLTAIVPLITRSHPLEVTVLQAMRCVSLIEFCMLAFILLSTRALGISWRSRIVGLTLGFGVVAVVDTICFIFVLRTSPHLFSWLLVRQTGSALAATIWIVYLLQPEPGRLAVSRKSSQLQRWNEIAIALGKPVPHVALGQPEPSPFFLQDVEAMVDRVLSRNEVEPPSAH